MSHIKMSCEYLNLPERFYQKLAPTQFENVELRLWNADLAKKIRIHVNSLSAQDKAEIFSGKSVLEHGPLVAQAYSGHQFGYFNPNMGDGRAALLGEVCDVENKIWDIHLKGIGRTAYSRRGDGKANLTAVVKEYLIGESLFGLGIPCSRVLSVVTTGEWVQRENAEPGAVMARVASSHLRVGTFEFCSARDDKQGLASLTEFFMRRHHPDLSLNPENCIELFRRVVSSQAALVAQWIGVGFVHGVLNTDNTFLSGETLDFGPCAFLEEYNPEQVFSRIDEQGRYAFSRQPQIVQWNLSKFGAALILLNSSEGESFKNKMRVELEKFGDLFDKYHLQNMGEKFGLEKASPEDVELMREYLEYLYIRKKDYTLGFRALSGLLGKGQEATESDDEIVLEEWFQKWTKRLARESKSLADVIQMMNSKNPVVIARNHKVIELIDGVLSNGNWDALERAGEVLRNPFVENADNEAFARPAKPDQKITVTYCNT